MVTFSTSPGPPTPAIQPLPPTGMCWKENAASGIPSVGVAFRIANLMVSGRDSLVPGFDGSSSRLPVTAYRVAWLTPFSSAR